MPSANGTCAITAAISGWRAATRDDVAAAERRAEQRDPLGSIPVEPARRRDRRLVVLLLAPDVDHLARAAAAVAEAAVVEQQHREAGVGVALGVGGQRARGACR